MPLHSRSFYELFMQGCPCNLYMDIEFDTELNPGLNGEICMRILRVVIKSEIFKLVSQKFSSYAKNCACFEEFDDKGTFVEMDASASCKFSRHVIAQLPGGIVFGTTGDCSVFVYQIQQSFLKCLENLTL